MPTILVVDDSSFARQSVGGMLKAMGNRVLEAANGYEGMEKAEEHKPDYIVLDLLMPEMNGIEVLRLLKEKGSDIPVIVLSADIQETTQKECMELGAIAFVQKPPKKDELFNILHGVASMK